jgi:hypothetical protein
MRETLYEYRWHYFISLHTAIVVNIFSVSLWRSRSYSKSWYPARYLARDLIPSNRLAHASMLDVKLLPKKN